MTFSIPSGYLRIETSQFPVMILMFVFWSFRRWRFASKFAMPNSAAGVSNVPASSQGHGTEHNHCDKQRRRRFWPFDRQYDRSRTQNCERIENPDEIFASILVFVQPAFPSLICHGEDAIVRLLAKFIDWPCGKRTDENQR